MFSKKKPAELPGPKDIPDVVGMHLVTQLKQNPDLVWRLKAALRPMPESKDVFDIRVFDEARVAAKKVTVENYSSLDEHPIPTI